MANGVTEKFTSIKSNNHANKFPWIYIENISTKMALIWYLFWEIGHDINKKQRLLFTF